VNFLADENVDRQIVERLRQDGYSVLFVAEMDPGIADEIVLHTANLTAAVLLTADKDFGDIVYRQRRGEPPNEKRDSGRKEASMRRNERLPLALSGVREGGTNVLLG